MRKNPSGFSLLELCAVVGIISVLALCAAPAFASYRRRASVLALIDVVIADAVSVAILIE